MVWGKIDKIVEDLIEKIKKDIPNSIGILQSDSAKSYFSYKLIEKLEEVESVNPKKRKFSTSSDENDGETKKRKSINKLEHTNGENGKNCIKLDPDSGVKNFLFVFLGRRNNDQQVDSKLFFCFDCFDEGDFRKSVNGTPGDLHNHWKERHSSSSPFRFYVFLLSKCFYCPELHTFPHLVKHHSKHHPNESFKVDERYAKNDLNISTEKVFNPIIYTEKLESLLTWNLSNEIGESSRSPQQATSNSVLYLFCGYCQQECNFTEYLEHFSINHFNWGCRYCSYTFNDIVDITKHEKNEHSREIGSNESHLSNLPNFLKNRFRHTKIVFSNGLVVEYYNLLRSKCKTSVQFDDLIMEYANKCKQRIRAMEIGMEELKLQLERVNKVFIGFSNSIEVSKAKGIFYKICKKLKMNEAKSHIRDISEIKRSSFIAEFKSDAQKIRKDFLDSAAKNPIRNRDLDDSIFKRENENSDWISIRPDMTKYYFDTWRTAENYKKEKKLHSFELGDKGLLVKRSLRDPGEFCLSKSDIDRYVN